MLTTQKLIDRLSEKYITCDRYLPQKTLCFAAISVILSSAFVAGAALLVLKKLPVKVTYCDCPTNLVQMTLSYLSNKTIYQATGAIFAVLSVFSLSATFFLYVKSGRLSEEEREDESKLQKNPLLYLNQEKAITPKEVRSAQIFDNMLRLNFFNFAFGSLILTATILGMHTKFMKNVEVHIQNQELIEFLKQFSSAEWMLVKTNWQMFLPSPFASIRGWLQAVNIRTLLEYNQLLAIAEMFTACSSIPFIYLMLKKRNSSTILKDKIIYRIAYREALSQAKRNSIIKPINEKIIAAITEDDADFIVAMDKLGKRSLRVISNNPFSAQNNAIAFWQRAYRLEMIKSIRLFLNNYLQFILIDNIIVKFLPAIWDEQDKTMQEEQQLV